MCCAAKNQSSWKDITRKNLFIVASAILSLGWFVSDEAHAGASASAASKPYESFNARARYEVHSRAPQQSSNIMELSSSSAKVYLTGR
jgi:hypothetical protein